MMPALSRRYRVASPQVIHETIDGEVVIIDIATGSYFSLAGVGAAIWALLIAGATEGAIVRALARHYRSDETAIAPAVRALLEELETERLLVRDGAREASDEPGAAFDLGASNGSFAPPTLHKYTDMQELISLDPIHEVDNTGWPNRLPEPAPAADPR